MEKLTPQQKEIEKQIQAILSGKMGTPAEALPWSAVAPLLPGMEGAMEMIGGYAGTQGEYDTQMAEALRRALSGEPTMGLDRGQIAKDYFKEVGAPMLRAFETEIAPRITQSFRQSGGLFSQARGATTGRALEGLQTTLASGLAGRQWAGTQLQAQLAEAAAGRQMGAIPMAELFAQRPLTRGTAYAGALSPFQQYQQQVRSAQVQEFLRTRPYESPWLKTGMSYLGIPLTEAVGIQGQQGPDWLGAGAMLGSAYIGSPQKSKSSGDIDWVQLAMAAAAAG